MGTKMKCCKHTAYFEKSSRFTTRYKKSYIFSSKINPLRIKPLFLYGCNNNVVSQL